MKAKTITAELTRTFNTGNYTSLKIGFAIEAVLEETDNPDEVMQTLIQQLNNQIEDAYTNYQKDNK